MTERLGPALDRALARLGLKPAADRQAAVRLWDEVAGAELRRHAQAVAVRGEVLEVRVADSAWANQIALLKQDLLDRLNARLAPARLRDLRVRVGRVAAPGAGDDPAGEGSGGAGGEAGGDRPRALTPEEIDLAKRDLRRILETENVLAADLRRALLEFAARAEARRRRAQAEAGAGAGGEAGLDAGGAAGRSQPAAGRRAEEAATRPDAAPEPSGEKG
ncbi:MAG: DUF721 domain-containing protein [Firmicutes bacterium]|nr:DUF721 domain-containing protein [Bacillota bacterium]